VSAASRVYQLVLESPGHGALCCGGLSLPGGTSSRRSRWRRRSFADGEPCLGEMAHLQIAGLPRGPPILVGTQPRIDGVC